MTVAPDSAFWDGIASFYADKPVEDPDAFQRKIALTRERIHPGDLVVDMGCGTGSLALILADTGAELHGLDCSPAMIDIARGKARDQQVDVTFHVDTVDTTTAFADDSVDVLMAYSLLHLVHDHEATLAACLRRLKPGGHFVSSTVCLGASWIPYAPLLTMMAWVGKAPRGVRVIRATDLLATMRAVGFVDVEAHDVGASSEICFATARKPLS